MELIEKTIGQCLEEKAKICPGDISFQYNGEIFTWDNVNKITNKLMHDFINKGVKKDDMVGILGSNSASWIFGYFAVVKLGAVAVLINASFKEREMIKCIKASGMKFLLYTSGYKNFSYEKMIKSLSEHEDAKDVEYINIEKTNQTWKYYMTQEIDVGKTAPDVKSSEIACILFTSGTTGEFKGVKLSHHSVVNNANAIVHHMRWNKDDCLCLAVPLFHCFGTTVSLIAGVIAGFRTVVLEKYNTKEVCKTIQNEKCTVLNGVPSMFLAMLMSEEREKYTLNSLRSGIIAGSPIYMNDYMDICGMFRNMRLQTSYGLTETSPCVSISGYDDSLELKAVSSGKIIEHVQVKIINDRTGEECKINEPGEIYVKGYNVTMGYLDCGGNDLCAADEDGWLKTGDIGYFDQHGYLYPVCRKKNIMIIGGENISPNEISELIREAAGRKEVFVCSIKTRIMQEEMVACIEGEENPAELDEIKRYLDANLSRYKIPKHFIFLNKMPRNSTGKLDEKKIRELVLQAIKISEDSKNQDLIIKAI